MKNYKVSGLTGDMAVLEMGSESGLPLVVISIMKPVLLFLRPLTAPPPSMQAWMSSTPGL